MSDSMILDREIDESEIFSLERRLMFSQEMIISKKKKISQARMDLERMQGGYQEVRVATTGHHIESADFTRCVCIWGVVTSLGLVALSRF